MLKLRINRRLYVHTFKCNRPDATELVFFLDKLKDLHVLSHLRVQVRRCGMCR